MAHITRSDYTNSPELAAGRRWYIRLVILMVLLLTAFTVVFNVVSSIYLRETEKHTVETILQNYVEMYAGRIEEILTDTGITELSQLYERSRNTSDRLFAIDDRVVKFAMLVNTAGQVIQHSDQGQEGSVIDITGPFEKAFEGKTSLVHSYINIDGEMIDVIDITVPFRLNGAIRGALRMGCVQSALNPMIYREKAGKGIRRIGALFIALIVVIFLVYSVYIYRTFERHYAALLNERDLLAKQQIELIGTGIVHEVKNSLNGIRMNAQLLQDSLNDIKAVQREKLRKKVERIQNEATRTGTVLSEFLTYAKPAEFSPAYVNLAALLEDLAQFFEPECRQRNIVIRETCSEGLTSVYADEQLLRHGISNLLWNAIQAVETDGEITLKGKQVHGRACIRVSDTGGGMTSEEAQKAFEVFYSTKPKGAGLGLSIVQRVAAMHDGTVQVENRTGEGCTFTIQIPLRMG
jgi:signal transduction histidine kinase